MALRKFIPDLDLYDPDDEEGWIGTWEHDDGSSLYGLGDPEDGRALLAANDAEGPEPGAPNPNQAALDANQPQADFQSPYQQQRGPMSPAAAPAAPAAAPVPAPAAAVVPRAGWEDDVPPQVASALRDQATAANLNPDILAAIIKHESGWNPASVNKDTGKHGGLIQFDRDATWPGVAKAAGRPDVSFEQALGMSAEEQIPFVVAYYKDKGLTPESTAGDYYKRTFMPGFAQEGDDFVLGEKDSKESIGNLNKGKVWEQNQGLDLNKDGRITNGEVRQVGDNKYAAQGAAGARPGMPGPGGAQLPAAAMGSQFPSTMNGLPASQIQMNGVPLTPEQIRQQQQGITQRFATTAQAHQQAQDARLQGRQEAMTYVQQLAEQEKADALGAIAKKQEIRNQAAAKVQQIVGEPIQKIDPKRVISNMSTGQKVMGAIAVLLSAIGQAANSMIGVGGGNTALQVLDRAIESDIQSQKDALDRGERSQSNRLAYWRQVLGDADAAVEARRAELKHAAGMMIQAKAMGQDIADIKAQGMEYGAQLFAQGQAEMDKLIERENQRMTIQYETPKGPAPGGADKLLENLRAMKEIEQELKMSGASDAQIDAVFRANGLARLGGETVPQATRRTENETSQRIAREGAEAKADEETSKELQPVNEAEDMWRRALKQLDDLEGHALVGKRYKPGGFIEGTTSTWPGFPSMDEQNAFDQAITAATNAQIAALGRASDSDEDRIKHETIGGGDVQSYRRGILNQLDKLQKRRTMLSSRREGSAERVSDREEEEREKMRPVTGKVYIPGAGPMR